MEWDSSSATIRIGSKSIKLSEVELNRDNVQKLVRRYRKRYTRYRYSPLILAITGTLLLVFSFIWNIWILPSMVVIPEGMDMTIEHEGRATIVNESNGEYFDTDVKAVLTSSFGRARGDTIDVTQTLEMFDRNTGEDLIAKYEGLLESEREFLVNRRTGAIESGGDGQMLLPIGNVKRTDYSFFNIDTNSSGILSFSGESERAGLDTLRFDMSLNREFMGEYQAGGPVPPTDIYFDGETTYWFEERTGIPVDAEREMELNVELPDLLKIPDGLAQKRVLVGNATLVDIEDTTKTRDINMLVLFNISTVLQLGNTLVMWENATGFDADTGKILPEIYQIPNYERLISIDQKSAKHVYDKRLVGNDKYHDREGYWLFPFGRMDADRDTYPWFNQVTNTTMDCVYMGKEEHKGVETLWYRSGAENYKMKPQDSKMENMIMIFDGFMDYWADEETGIVHDIRLNFTYSILSVNDPDDFANKTRLASVDCVMSEGTLKESLANLTQARGFFPHSGKRLTVFVADLEISEGSGEELAELAGDMSTQLFMGEIIVPYTCAALGIASLFAGGFLKRKRDIFYLE